jgi:hypothetical protein
MRIRGIGGAALAAIVLAAAPEQAMAQPDGFLSGNIKYNAGQSVQPIFEGWTKNADGSVNFWFGYLNRNHVQELHVPIGADNWFEPGDADRGQPTYFYPRFNRQLFSVTVPANWGQKELIWTLVANGKSEKAVGWLRPDWEIAPPGTRAGEGNEENQPPKLTVRASASHIGVASALSLTAAVIDDGLPKPRSTAKRTRPAGPPTFDYDSKLQPPVNVPQVERPARPRADGQLQVEWIVWRGPTGVSFTPSSVTPDKGQAVTSASFTQPGEYVLRTRATDSLAFAVQDVKVVVSAGRP